MLQLHLKCTMTAALFANERSRRPRDHHNFIDNVYKYNDLYVYVY